MFEFVRDDDLSKLFTLECFCIQVTPLGIRLSHLPIEPSLTKMIFLSMTLKCLDPVLTIACCLARGSPFIEEVSSSISEGLLYSPFPCNSAPLLANDVDDSNIGDHLVLLKAYQLWHNAANETAKNEVVFFFLKIIIDSLGFHGNLGFIYFDVELFLID